jgi:hypothetical protein
MLIADLLLYTIRKVEYNKLFRIRTIFVLFVGIVFRISNLTQLEDFYILEVGLGSVICY